MYEEIARIAERGLFDMLFFGDGTRHPKHMARLARCSCQWGISWPRQEMSPLMTAMSRVTQHLGFGVTYSTTFMHPYYLARLLNSLDHVTGGRIAFNVITSTRRSDFQNYGFDDIMDHDARYDRMEEFIDVCRELWDSVESDAMIWTSTAASWGILPRCAASIIEVNFLRFEVRSIHHPRRKAGPSCFRREVHREESEPPPMLPIWRLVPTCRWNCKFANALNWIVN